MSGQPYRYFTDPTKYRTMYMDTLGLQADINALNLDANRTYKETGQLPAVSQMKDTRTTTEILADYEKLKIDIIQTIAKKSSVPFGQMVVGVILDSPLNSDNKLLVFTAQRIDDIMDNLGRIYKYGIKGDENDAEQLVNFIETMYNDKNYLVAQTKSFMNRYGMKSLSSASPFINLYENLTKIGATVRNYMDEFRVFEYSKGKQGEERGKLRAIKKLIYKSSLNKGVFPDIINQSKIIVDYIATLLSLIPTDPNRITAIEKMIIDTSQKMERGIYDTTQQFEQENYEPFRQEITKRTERNRIRELGNIKDQTGKLGPKDVRYIKREYEEEADILEYYLDFLNRGLPNDSMLMSLIQQLIQAYEVYSDSDDRMIQLLQQEYSKVEADEDSDVYFRHRDIEDIPIYNAVLNNARKYLEILVNLENALQPTDYWDVPRLNLLKKQIDKIETKKPIISPPQVSIPTKVEVVNQPQQTNLISNKPEKSQKEELQEIIDELEKLRVERVMNVDRVDEILTQIDNEYLKDFTPPEGSDTGVYIDAIDEAISFLEEEVNKLTLQGKGLRRRGRPKGCGISKPKTYKESVKAHSVLDKGIMETPRFLKFGKYLINTHKLNNEDIFALKRPAGGNIVDIPSIKISKNLSSVIKKMLGGEIPTYSDISKLSEPEKAYLHKVSQKSNILDKFDIPAPSKDQKEKDIHQFEVMKGEILAGNDNKELIKKFKAHILKLSKNGTLPKREVQEILEDLLELGN